MSKGKRRLSANANDSAELAKLRTGKERPHKEDEEEMNDPSKATGTEVPTSDNDEDSTSSEEEVVIEDDDDEELENMTDADRSQMPSEMTTSNDVTSAEKVPIRLFRPTVDHLAEGEELVVDEEYYEINRKFGLGDPCVCFDIVPDRLGVVRHKGPHTITLIGGTQAEQRKNNGLIVAKLSNIKRTFIDEDMTDSDSDDDDDDENGSHNPKFASQKIVLGAEVNVVKVCPQNTWLVAAFLDDSNVQVHSIRDQLQVLEDPTKYCNAHQKPLYTFSGHTSEGFALEWCPTQEGYFVTGSRDTAVKLIAPVEAGFQESATFRGHKGSVEGLSWKVDDSNIFASASADQSIRIWDRRQRDPSCIIPQAHNGDVNVVCFHRLEEPHQLLSGGDDGWTKVRDIRMADQTLACYDWHKQPICAVDWHPTDGSMYLSAGYDNQLTIWSLDVEGDNHNNNQTMTDFPDQLMFQHLGLKDVTAARWHPQIPGMIICNGSSEFSLFKPIKAVFGHVGEDDLL